MNAPRRPRVPELLTMAVIGSACGCGPDPEPSPQECRATVLADGGVQRTGNCDAGTDTGSHVADTADEDVPVV